MLVTLPEEVDKHHVYHVIASTQLKHKVKGVRLISLISYLDKAIFTTLDAGFLCLTVQEHQRIKFFFKLIPLQGNQRIKLCENGLHYIMAMTF